MTEDLNFKFDFILINLNVSDHTWIVATLLDPHEPHVSQYKGGRAGGGLRSASAEEWRKAWLSFWQLQTERPDCFRPKKKDGLSLCNAGDDDST